MLWLSSYWVPVMIHVHLAIRDSIEISCISSMLNVSFLRLYYRKYSDAFLLLSEVTSILLRESIDLTVPLSVCLKVIGRVQCKTEALCCNYIPYWICNPQQFIKSKPFLNPCWVWCIPHKMKSDWMFPWVFQHQHVGQAPHPFMSEFLCICQRKRKRQEFCVLCGHRQKLTFRGDDLFHTKRKRWRAGDEIGPGVVSGGVRLGSRFHGDIPVFTYVEVMSSSPGLFICSG